MNLYEIYTSDSEALKIAKIAFPEFKKREVEIRPFKGPMRLDSYWSGGSRDYYAIVNLATYKKEEIPENGSGFTENTYRMSELPNNLAVVRFHLGGSYEAVTIYVNQENLINMLPPKTEELAWEELVVLVATRSLKPPTRYKEANYYTKITEKEYMEAKANLITKGYLNSAGAITQKGKNAAPFDQYSGLHSLRRNQTEPSSENNI